MLLLSIKQYPSVKSYRYKTLAPSGTLVLETEDLNDTKNERDIKNALFFSRVLIITFLSKNFWAIKIMYKQKVLNVSDKINVWVNTVIIFGS